MRPSITLTRAEPSDWTSSASRLSGAMDSTLDLLGWDGLAGSELWVLRIMVPFDWAAGSSRLIEISPLPVRILLRPVNAGLRSTFELAWHSFSTPLAREDIEGLQSSYQWEPLQGTSHPLHASMT